MPSKKQLANAARSYLREAHPVVLSVTGAPLTGKPLAAAMKKHAWAPVAHADKSIYVTIAYALVCLHCDDAETLAAVEDSLEKWKPRGRDAARLFVQALHKPIDAWQNKPQQATNFYSRYAGAVRHLIGKGDLPSVALANSGSVSEWEKAHAASRKPAVTKRPSGTTPAEIRIKHRGQKYYWTSNDQKLIASLMRSLNKRATRSAPHKATQS